ncbi:MAG: S1C family serine protease [Mycobacteriaceae bacterium]|uniref:S1C family serine protease n=1 Tax=Corynebacterium sp. TaxID=1720 RepID=UPI003F989C6C
MSDDKRSGEGFSGESWGRKGGTPDGQQGPEPDFTDSAAQQRRWESLSAQYPGQGQGPNQNPDQGPGQNPGQFPGQPPQGVATAQRTGQATPRRFSTPAVAALLVAVAVGASAVTAGIVRDGDDNSNSGATTSFNQQNSGDRENTAAEPDPGTVEDVANKVLPSVVSIQTQSDQGEAEGSGSIISPDGLILTNNHVVAGAEEGGGGRGGGGGLVVNTNDGRQLEAEVVATDPQTDLAVVKAEGADDLQPIATGDSESMQVGETVVAVGSPLGLSSTVTTGIVSAKNRPVQAGGEDGGEASLIDAIQTDAAINPGNSGGALVNLEGELVGIPSVIATLGGGMGGESGSIGLGFAIPSNQAEKTSQQLIDDGKATHPVIGAEVNTQSAEVGAEIVSVTDGSPAEEGGLRDGDVVTKVGDRVVDSGVSLIAAIRSHSVGDQVTLTVTDGDGGDERELDVTLDESD